MGDLGYFDDEGQLWFCGRKAHRVQTADALLFSVQCEAVFNSHPGVYRTALVGIEAQAAKEPVLVVELEKEGAPDKARIKTELLELGQQNEETRAIEQILFHPSFPVDIRHNAKIYREKLALWAQKKLR